MSDETTAITQQLEAMDMLAAGITTPTITREEAAKWGMLCSDFYRWSCLVREVAAMPLEKRRQWIADVARKQGEEAAERFREALKFEWEKLRNV